MGRSRTRGGAGPTRRQFAAAVGLLAAAPLVPPAVGAPDTPSPVEMLATTAESLSEIVRLRHGKNLTKAQLKQVQLAILRGLYSARRMRKVTLHNGDEPAFIFSPDPS